MVTYPDNEDKRDKGNKKPKSTPMIDQFGEDLTQMAAEGKLDPIIGREKEVYRICQILSRRKKNNPIILGDPGVGKTAIIEAIAQRINDKKVARTLFNKRIVSLNINNIVAGTKYRGEFEERMKNIVEELKENKQIIIFIDEIHTLVGAGGVSGSLDASNILKPALATTLDEYREHIEDDGALTRRFQEVFIDPPSIEDTIEILKRIKGQYEDHHSVQYTDEALEACVKLSERYITQRELPDKAIDVMDEAGSKIHMQEVKVPSFMKKMETEAEELKEAKLDAVNKQDYEQAANFRDLEMKKKEEIETKLAEWESNIKNNRTHVTEEDVAATIADITGIPVTRLTGDENKMIAGMAGELKKLIIGQDSAVDALCRVIRRSRAGVSSADKPIGSFVFLGPTGVGKCVTGDTMITVRNKKTGEIENISISDFKNKLK
jgi:ATP-dependent Clp protease ATP-binding subunit ClpC